MKPKIVRMVTAGRKRRVKQQKSKEHDTLTKHAWKAGRRKA